MITTGSLRAGWRTARLSLAGHLTAGLLASGCGGNDAQPMPPQAVAVQPAPMTTFGTGTALSASTSDEFSRNFVAIACAAYEKVCGCDAAHADACSAEQNLAAVDLYDCMFTRAYCASPAGASACPGIGDQSRKTYLQGNALCAQLDAPSLRCATWMSNTFGGEDGKYARVLWDASDPYPGDVDTLIATCMAPPRAR
jgi:hypothetical protein